MGSQRAGHDWATELTDWLYDLVIPLLGIYSKILHLFKRYKHPIDYSSTIYNSQDMKAIHVSFNKQMDKDVRCVVVCIIEYC